MRKSFVLLLLILIFTGSIVSADCEGIASFESPLSATCSSEFNQWYVCDNIVDDVKTSAWLSGWGDTTSPEVIVDLGDERCISELKLNDWVQSKRVMNVSISSDGANYFSLMNEEVFTPNNQMGSKISFTETQARYVKFNF